MTVSLYQLLNRSKGTSNTILNANKGGLGELGTLCTCCSIVQ